MTRVVRAFTLVVLTAYAPATRAQQSSQKTYRSGEEAAQALGMETSPVFIVDGIDPVSEMRFNQLHNGTDLDTGDENVRVPPCDQVGYVDVPHGAVKGNLKAKGKGLRAAIIELITGLTDISVFINYADIERAETLLRRVLEHYAA